MTRLKMAGFESGHVDVFDVYAAGQGVSATYKRTGAYGLDLTNALWWDRWVLTGNPAEIYGRLGVYFPTSPTNPGLVVFSDSDIATQLTLRINATTRVLEVYRGATWLASGGVLNVLTWYCVEFRVKIDNANGVVQVKLDGIQVINFAGDTQDQADAEVGAVQFGGGGGLYAALCYLDDLAINDTAGAVNNSWIGRGGIWMCKPSGVGTYAQMTPSAGANWTCVDEIPPTEDTDYVQHDTAAKVDSYAMTDLTPVAGTIAAVKWQCRAKLSVAGLGSIKYQMRQAGVDYTGADKALDVSYRNVWEILELAPSGVAWTVAIVNALEAGQQVV